MQLHVVKCKFVVEIPRNEDGSFVLGFSWVFSGQNYKMLIGDGFVANMPGGVEELSSTKSAAIFLVVDRLVVCCPLLMSSFSG
jgi:hypothetical protein